MLTEKALPKTDIAMLIVSVAQIIGLIAVVALDGPLEWVIAGIAGFAAVVKYFLPTPGSETRPTTLNTAAAVCGVFLILFATVSAVR